MDRRRPGGERRFRTASVRTAVGLCAGLALATGGPALATPRTPIVASEHFAMFSDFESNLNDALIAAGLARKHGKPELFHADSDAACFSKLPPSERAAWNGAVDYYAEVISPAEWNAREQFAIRMDLVGFDAESRADGAAEQVEIARNFRAVAAPAYRACRWALQDERNRSWIADMEARLAAGEQTIAPRLEQLYQTRWKKLPILVDVVETVNWSGANSSWSDSGQGDILIANSPQGAAGFETLFHEASHMLMDRDDPVPLALERAAKMAGAHLPNDLWHVVLFFTTGEAMRHFLDQHGEPGYAPMVYGIFGRGTWTAYRSPLENAWRPYVDGEQSLADAAAALIAALGKKTPPPR